MPGDRHIPKVWLIVVAALAACGTSACQRTVAKTLRVVDGEGKPVLGAEVWVLPDGWFGRPEDDGGIRLPELPLGLSLEIIACGYKPMIVRLDGSEFPGGKVSMAADPMSDICITRFSPWNLTVEELDDQQVAALPSNTGKPLALSARRFVVPRSEGHP